MGAFVKICSLIICIAGLSRVSWTFKTEDSWENSQNLRYACFLPSMVNVNAAITHLQRVLKLPSLVLWFLDRHMAVHFLILQRGRNGREIKWFVQDYTANEGLSWRPASKFQPWAPSHSVHKLWCWCAHPRAVGCAHAVNSVKEPC